MRWNMRGGNQAGALLGYAQQMKMMDTLSFTNLSVAQKNCQSKALAKTGIALKAASLPMLAAAATTRHHNLLCISFRCGGASRT